MKPATKILIYDEHCPMCVAYTKAFVKTGILSKEERRSFTEAGEEWLSKIDFSKGRNEIPLIDIQTQKVYYGIDALLEVLDAKIPCVKTIGKIKPVNWFLKRLYKFISYNRKVIVGASTKFNCVDCTPDFNVFYRIFFMVFFLAFNTIMLNLIHRDILFAIPSYKLSLMELQLLHFSLVGINVLISTRFSRKQAVEYLGQVNMLALTTILLMIPLLFAKTYVHISFLTISIYLLLTTVLVISEYFRRMRFAGISDKNKWVMLVNFISLGLFLSGLFIHF